MKPKKKSKAAERVKRLADGMASATKGRARVFQDRKKEASRKACRGKATE